MATRAPARLEPDRGRIREPWPVYLTHGAGSRVWDADGNEYVLGRGDWQTRVETDSHMSSTATEFLVTQRLEAFERDERVYERTWELRLPRDCV